VLSRGRLAGPGRTGPGGSRSAVTRVLAGRLLIAWSAADGTGADGTGIARIPAGDVRMSRGRLGPCCRSPTGSSPFGGR
jgi:hypothetical protein